jgi:2-succinyl-5-enolpyruvyl-6-hydroxy-3-cyclohexene-1-carboxylate synthase
LPTNNEITKICENYDVNVDSIANINSYVNRVSSDKHNGVSIITLKSKSDQIQFRKKDYQMVI